MTIFVGKSLGIIFLHGFPITTFYRFYFIWQKILRRFLKRRQWIPHNYFPKEFSTKSVMENVVGILSEEFPTRLGRDSWVVFLDKLSVIIISDDQRFVGNFFHNQKFRREFFRRSWSSRILPTRSHVCQKLFLMNIPTNSRHNF